MKFWKMVRMAVLMSGCAFVLTGCASFFALQGDGPLQLDQTGNWANISAAPAPDPEQMKSIADGLKSQRNNIFSGKQVFPGDGWMYQMPGIDPRETPFLPALDMRVAMNINIWARFLPSVRHDQYLYYRKSPGSRDFYCSSTEWGCGVIVGDFIAAGDQSDAYDVATAERVAAQKRSIFLTLLGCARERRVMPVDSNGIEGLHALSDPKLGKTDVRWNEKDATILLGGLLGWGTVNHTRYVQVVFIPIAVGHVKR